MADESTIGPALPPGFIKSKQKTKDDIDDKSSEVKPRTIGPTLPHGLAIGGHSGSSDSESDSEDSLNSNSENSDHEKSSNIIGPIMPSNSKTQHKHRRSKSDALPHTEVGHIMPHGFSDKSPSSGEESDGGFGPRPPVPGASRHLTVAEEFEKRAEKMKHRLLHGEEEKAPVRETWMTELPSGGLAKHMGLTARKLGKGSAVKDQDQSVWTDTPADRERKQQDELEGRGVKRSHEEGPVRSQRDVRMSEQVEDYNKKKRAESLMDLHAKKIRKEKKKEEKKKKKEKKKKSKKEKKSKKKSLDTDEPTRVAFDRDRDLKVNRFDSAQRNALVKRSQELNTRFGAGAKQFI